VIDDMNLKHILTTAGVISLLIIGHPNAQAANIMGAGVKASCGKWLADRASGNYFIMLNWALGFLSGVGIYTKNLDPLNGVDGDAVAYWLDDYCRSHPTTLFSDAVNEFVFGHPR
jgi:hypothetical protein